MRREGAENLYLIILTVPMPAVETAGMDLSSD